jgi:hypothetical protein
MMNTIVGRGKKENSKWNNASGSNYEFGGYWQNGYCSGNNTLLFSPFKLYCIFVCFTGLS